VLSYRLGQQYLQFLFKTKIKRRPDPPQRYSRSLFPASCAHLPIMFSVRAKSVFCAVSVRCLFPVLFLPSDHAETQRLFAEELFSEPLEKKQTQSSPGYESQSMPGCRRSLSRNHSSNREPFRHLRIVKYAIRVR